MKKDIYKVFSSNLMKMMVTFITAFIVPMVLSINSYGYLKTYQFYASFIGITHLGFCDGVYLYYGGKNEKDLRNTEISDLWSSLFFYEFLVSIIVFSVGFFTKNLILVCVGLTIVPNVLFTFYSYIYQAIGNFSKYTLIMNIYSVTSMFINLILVLNRIKNYKIYMILYVFIESVPFIVGTILFLNKKWIRFSGFHLGSFQYYVKNGLLLMVGNFIYSIFIGIDKWFIKFTMPISDFSIFSFASQMLMVVNMFITPIAMTLYSNMAKKKNKKFEIRIKKILICILMLIPLSIYVLKVIISTFMKRYIPAIDITSVFLITQIFLSLNVAIFVNLYKAYRKQGDYFIRLIFSLLIAIAIDSIVTIIRPNIMGFAFSTMISCVVWLLMNINYFSYMKPKKGEVFYVCGLLLIYLFTLNVGHVFLEIIIYVLCYIFMTKKFMPEQWSYLTRRKNL